MNEFASLVTGLVFVGPDQGIDFTGDGAIHAPVDLKWTRVAGPGETTWIGGHVLVAEILNPKWREWCRRNLGDDRYGRFVYFAEAVQKVLDVKIGAVTRKGHQVANLHSQYPGCEIGFAQDAHGTPFGTPHDGKNGNPHPHGDAIRAWVRHLSEHW